MHKHKNVLIVMVVVVAIVFCFSLDFTKRQIGSYNHKITIPGYMSDLELEGGRMWLLLDEPITQGMIPKDSLNAFYKAINGIDSFSIPVQSDSLGGAYVNDAGDVHGVWFKSADAGHYQVKIKSFYN